MKHKITIIALLTLVVSFCTAQTNVVGNYIGQLTGSPTICTIKVKRNHKYIMKTYDAYGKTQRKTRGEWYMGGEKLVLKERTGSDRVLEKYDNTNTWYITGNSPYTFSAKFYQNLDTKEFREALKNSGC